MARVLIVLVGILALIVVGGLILVPVQRERAISEQRQSEYADRARVEARRARAESISTTATVAARAGEFEVGIDAEPDLNTAIARAADYVRDELHDRWGRRRHGRGRVYVRALESRDRDEAKLLVGKLRRRDIDATSRANRGASIVIDFVIANTGDGKLLELRNGVSKTIEIDPRMERTAIHEVSNADHRNRGYGIARHVIRFKTGPTLDEESSREDARDFLAKRITDHVAGIATSHGWVDIEDLPRFRQILDLRYPRDVLIEMGASRINPEAEDEFFRSRVVWSAESRDLDGVAKGVSQTLVIENREPWIKLGLSVGFLVLTVLGWLKTDWWLKGHYSFLTKMAFAMLFFAILGILWSVTLHA